MQEVVTRDQKKKDLASKIFSKKTIGVTAVLILIISVFFLINTYGVQRVRENIEIMGPWAPIGIFFLRFISIIIPALPSTAYSLLAGAILGFEKGLLIICLADYVSCSISFYISRNYGRGIVKKLVGNKFMSKVEKFSHVNLEGNFFLMTGVLMTGLFDFMCYGIGLTKIPWSKFAPALIISILISTPPVVGLGAGLLDGGKRILILGIAGVLILSYIANKVKKKSTL